MDGEYAAFSPAELARRLGEACGTPLPFPRSLALVLGRAFRVSLDTEEGRPLRATLALTAPGTSLASEELLEPSLDALPETMRRLACATDPERSCLHLACSDEPRPSARIVGIAARPDPRDGLTGSDLVLVDVTDPACVGVRHAAAEVRFERDVFRIPDARRAIEAALSDAVARTLSRALTPDPRAEIAALPGGIRVPRAAWSRHGSRFLEHVEASGRGVLADGLAQVLGDVRRLGHGGTVVVTLGSRRATDMRLRSLTDDAFRVAPVSSAPGGWNRGILAAVACAARRDLVLQGFSLGGDAEGRVIDLERACTEAQEGCDRAQARWREDARRCAHLTQVDGAVVLDALLEPLVFGMKVTLDNYAFLPEEWRTWLEPRGTRHRATACLADLLEPALAFAVSQDGGVTMFRKEMGREPVVHQVSI